MKRGGVKMKKVLYSALFFFILSAPIMLQAGDFNYNPNLVRAFHPTSFAPLCLSSNADFTCQGEIGFVNINGHDYSSEENPLMSCNLGSFDYQGVSAIEDKTVSMKFFNARCAYPAENLKIDSPFPSLNEAVQACAEKDSGTCEFIWKDNSGKFFIGSRNWGAAIVNSALSAFQGNQIGGGMSGSSGSSGEGKF